MSRLVNTNLRILILICLVVIVAESGLLAVSLPYNTTYLGGSGRSFDVSSNVTWITDPGIHYHYYLYQYIVTFNASTATKSLKNFSVNNMYRLPWIDAYTSHPSVYSAPMSYSSAQTSVTWAAPGAGVASSTGGTVEFGYYSQYEYIDTTGFGSGSGWSASGHTLGMVPEPGTLAALGLGLSGVAGALVRGARRRRK